MRECVFAIDKFHRSAIRHRNLHWKVVLIVVREMDEAEINRVEIAHALHYFWVVIHAV